MRANDPSNWHKCILCHEDLWALDLSQQEIIAYTYLSSFCHKGYPISLRIMARAVHMDNKRLKRAIDSLIARNMVEKSKPRVGYPCVYKISAMSRKGWGQTPLPIGSNAPTPLGSNTPRGEGQTPLLTTYLDSDFLALFQPHFMSWTFNRKPMGRFFVFTRKMQSKCLEMMRHMFRSGMSNEAKFHEFLNTCGEYMALDRDPLSPNLDMRALSPSKWLDDWPEQVRRVGIYIDEKARKITRMPVSDTTGQITQ